MVFTALVSTFSTMQYHNAIITAESEDVAKDVLELAMAINVIITLLCTALILLGGNWISRMYNSKSLNEWLLLAPLSVFFTGINNTFSSWAIRRKKFKLLSYNRIATALLSPVISIALGFLLLGPIGLFAGLLMSQIIPTLRMTYYFFKLERFKINFNKARLITVSRLHKNFALFSLPSEVINNLSNQLPVMLLSRTGGINVVGFYNLGVRILGLPSSLVSNSIGEVFRQRATHDYFTAGSCRPIFIKVFKTLILISIPPLIVIVFLGPDMFAFVFGENWREAGVIAQILAVLYAFKFVVSPLSYTTYIASKQWAGLAIDIILLGVLLVLLFIAKQFHFSYKTSLLVFALAYSALYFVTFYLSYKFTINDKFSSKNYQ